MIQRHISHPSGTFRRCATCAREPLHIVSHGTTSATQSDPRHPAIGIRHHLECARCGHRTALAASAHDAISAWVIYAQPATKANITNMLAQRKRQASA